MVLSQHRGFRFPLSDRAGQAPNPLRIAATSTALALHVLALLVLLTPAAIPPPVVEPDVVRPVLILAEPKIHPSERPPVIEKVEVEKKPPIPVPTLQPRQDTRVEDVPLVSDLGSVEYVAPVADAGPATPTSIDAGPVAAVRLEYAEAPAPAYPRQALRMGLQGVVMLQVTVDVDGRPIDVVVAQSSGHRDLDLAARQQVLKRWRFRPAMKDGAAVQAVGLVPVSFTLRR